MISTTLAYTLRSLVGDTALLTAPEDCWVYGYDNSRRQALPDAVVFANTHEQIAEIVKLCYTHKLPLTARGRGTGTPGGSVPVQGGIVLALERMNRILHTDAANRLMIVEPGVTNEQVQQAAGCMGFFWPPDPSSAAYCTIGGNLAYNAAGPRAVKYGTPRENTLGLRAITGDGRSIRTGVYTTKGVVGYDLTRLLIGSEGTLAIITEATLKLTPLPESKRTLCAIYKDIHSAGLAISRLMSQPTTPSALELMDSGAIGLIRHEIKTPLPAAANALLLIEIDGPENSLNAAVDKIYLAAGTQETGLLEIHVAHTSEEIASLWQMRKALSPALRAVAPKKINEDVVVPVAQIATLLDGIEQLAHQYEITIINFGHAGNGNIHVNLLIDPDDPAQVEHAQACLADIFHLVLSLKGTLSGEHGVGLEKRPFIHNEIDPPTLGLMQQIKQQFDPLHILNPGKIFLDEPIKP